MRGWVYTWSVSARMNAVLAALVVMVGLQGFGAPAAALEANRDAVRPTEDTSVGIAGENALSNNLLHLRTGTYRLREKQLPADALTAKGAAGAQHREEVFLQFYSAPTPSERAALAGRGVVLRRYLNANTFLALVPAGDMERLLQLANVRALGGVPVTDKIEPRLLARAVGPHALAPDGTLTVTVVFHADAEVHGEATEAVFDAGGVVVTYLDVLHGAVVRLPSARLERLAAHPTVEWVEPMLPLMEAQNDGARTAMHVPEVNAAPHNLEGAGVKVLVYDAGTVDDTHPTFGGRVTVGEPPSIDPHATHVAGTVGGDGTDSPANVYRGMANAVDIVSYELDANFSTPGWLYTDPGDIEANYTQAINQYDVVLATNSIGVNTAKNGYDCAWEGDYPATSQLIDSIVGGAIHKTITDQPQTFGLGDDTLVLTGPFIVTESVVLTDPTNTVTYVPDVDYVVVPSPDSPDTTYVIRQPSGTIPAGGAVLADFAFPLRLPMAWSAGNERGNGRCGIFYRTISPPSAAKNPIVVGAINSNNLTMTSFSSWGPTDDGRIKPDVVAPGCQSDGDLAITSALWGTIPEFVYAGMCGTSMATPGVAGIMALLAERRPNLPDGGMLSPDLAKALLAHTAVDLGPPGPDYKFGYGLVRADRAVEYLNTGAFVEGRVFHNDFFQQTVIVPEGATSVRITLAWADAPGTPMSAVNLVNDLDLVVFLPDLTTRAYPWTVNPAQPMQVPVRTNPDGRNNIEQVEISTRFGDTVPSGHWIVRVLGANVPSTAGQTFALCYDTPPAVPEEASGPNVDYLTFGPVNLGGGALNTTFRVINQGGASLSVTGVGFSSPNFWLYSPPAFPAAVPPDGSLPLQVAYVPTSGGIHQDTMIVATSDPNQPTLEIPLSGSTPPTTLEDFDATGAGYAPSAGWEWGSSRVTPAPFSTNLWGTHLSGDYANDADWTLTSPPIPLAGLGAAQLAFDHFYQTEAFGDVGNLKISVNGGPFTLLIPDGGYPVPSVIEEPPTGAGKAGTDGEPGFSGASGGVQTVAVDLTPYVGTTVQIRWHFGSNAAVTDLGWYIDDVRLYTDKGPEVVWLSPPPATIGGNVQFSVEWRTDRFGKDLTENRVYYGIKSVIGESADYAGPPGTFGTLLTSPNVGQAKTYQYVVRALSEFVSVLSPIVPVNVVPGAAPPTVTWVTPPPASAPSGSTFRVAWQVSNYVTPAAVNAVGWGITNLLGAACNQAGGNGTYECTVTAPETRTPGTLYYTAYAENAVEFAYASVVPVQITVP